MWLRGWAGLALLVGACGSDGASVGADAGPEQGPDAAVAAARCESNSGTRYRLQRLETADGVSAVEGLWDSELGVKCETFAMTDGVVRCMPLEFEAGLVYTDAACSAPLAGFLPTELIDPPLVMLSNFLDDGCTYERRFYSVGDEIVYAEGDLLYARTTDGLCVETPATAGSYYPLGAEIELPAFEVVGLGGDTRLDLDVYQGADGSRLCSPVTRDRVYDRPCNRFIAEDGELHCLPTFQVYGSGFTDPTCTTPRDLAVDYSACGGDPPSFAMSYDAQNDCVIRFKLRELEAEVDPVYFGDSETCTAMGDEYTAYGVGPSVAPATFVGFQTEFTAGGGRLSPGELVADDGPRLPSGTFRDAALDRVCSFSELADGSLRCLPTFAPADGALVGQTSTLYSDAACTTEVQILTARSSCEAYAFDYVYGFDVDFGTHVYPVTGPYDGPLYLLGDACALFDADVLRFAVGAELEPDTFVLGERVVE